MDNKLYIGNLSFKTTEEDIQLLFGQAGTVKSVNLIKDRESGRSRGFAFVEMESADGAQDAINQFHGLQFQGRQITVNVARPKEDRPRDSRPRRRFDDQRGDRSSRRDDNGGERHRNW